MDMMGFVVDDYQFVNLAYDNAQIEQL